MVEVDEIEPKIVDQRGLGIREIIEGGFGPARTPGSEETVVVVQPMADRRTGPDVAEEEET